MKFKFVASVVIEASSEEDALSKIAGRVSNIARHVGSGVALADNAPFFTLTAADAADVAQDIADDPIRAARLAAEANAVTKAAATDAAAAAAPADAINTTASNGETK